MPCASRSGPGERVRPPLQPIPVVGPFHRLGVDVLTLPLTTLGNRYIVVFMDYLTKWPEVFPTSDHTAETIAHLLVDKIICRHGVPVELLSDRGPDFKSLLIREVCRLAGIKKINTSGYHPQTDGMIERFNKTLTDMLSKYAAIHGPQWDQYLDHCLFAYRMRPHSSTKRSPFELLYGREARLPTETMLTLPTVTQQLDLDDYATRLRTGLASAWGIASSNIEKAQQAYKTQFDKRATSVSCKDGDKVFIQTPPNMKARGRYGKLGRQFQGPFVVDKVRGNTVVVTPFGKSGQLRDSPLTVNLDRLRTAPKKSLKTFLDIY